jgi:DNA-binding response OmpR family regulator
MPGRRTGALSAPTRDHGVVQQRDAVRTWSRLDPASGSLALLDPDVDPCSPVLAELRALGIDVEVHADPLQGLVRIGARAPDTVVISAALPISDAGRFVEAIRSELSVPVLLAFRSDEIETIGPVVAAGALPVVERPYALVALLAALQAHWPRRVGRRAPLVVGSLQLDLDGYDAHLGTVGIDLTTVEFDLLAELAATPDHVVLRERLAHRFWPTSPDPDGALVATITRVRRKLAAAGAAGAIHTVRGLGYRLETSELRVASG